MEQRYIPPLPVPIIDAALEHVKTKYKADLDPQLLTELYWHIRWRTKHLLRAKRRDPTLKVSTGFYAVRDWVLHQRFPQRRPPDSFLRRAYASGLGKIGSEFRKRNDPRFNLKRSEHDRIMDFVTLDKDRRQYCFIT